MIYYQGLFSAYFCLGTVSDATPHFVPPASALSIFLQVQNQLAAKTAEYEQLYNAYDSTAQFLVQVGPCFLLYEMSNTMIEVKALLQARKGPCPTPFHALRATQKLSAANTCRVGIIQANSGFGFLMF